MTFSQRIEVLKEDQTWIHRDFLQEKLRTRERYWRAWERLEGLPPEKTDAQWIIPDALTWRKFLPLLTHLLEETRDCQFILLESVVECLDYRNSSPCIVVDGVRIPEASAVQERSKIKKILEQYPTRVVSFCDLSSRMEEGDEWDLMDYDKMTTLERCQHAILRASSMLIHQGLSNIVLISSDIDFHMRFTPDEGVHLKGMKEFLGTLGELNNVEVLLERCEEAYLSRNTPAKNEQNLAENTHEVDLQQGIKGRLNVTKENPKEGYVVANGETYFIDQERGHFNHALHQDVVVIQPLKESEWGRPVGRRRLVHYREDDEEINAGDEVDLLPPVPSARVLTIAVPSRRVYVATLVDVPMNDESACIVVPMDIRIPKIRIKTKMWRKFLGQRLLVQIDNWEIGNNYPAGHVVDIVGQVADLETEIRCLLHENELKLQPFSAEAIACLPPEGNKWTVPERELFSRKDLRTSHRIFSVDPPGCQDIDDTMHARVLSNGDIEVGVHIADVTYFVPHNSSLDKEAQIRGTTFYLVDRRFDMLPTLLSSELCSLHGEVDRLAVSTIWVFSSDFKEVKSFWHGRTVIQNCQAMTYDQAHNILHDLPPDDSTKEATPPLTAGYPVDPANVDSLKHDLRILTQLARKLRKDREDIGGAVDLSSGDQGSELKFTLDNYNNPVKVVPKKQQEIHHTIAELMILANKWVAETIRKKAPDRALLRNHRSVEEHRFEDLKEVLNAGKISFDGTNNMALAESLKKAEKTTKSGSLMALFQSLATRAMSEAQYVSTGQTTDLSHYGLGLENYTHFTSPIRRYADVVVHKQLLAEQEEIYPKVDSAATSQRSAPLQSLPSSEVISILGGEGLERRTDIDTVAVSHTDDAQNQVMVPTTEPSKLLDQNAETKVPLYEAAQVSRICEGLNRQNRMAKFSSFECQSLFLSLYFKDHVEVTQAVVTSLRSNGFWVYVPRFDMRGAVFISDKHGNVQVDPALFGLSSTAGKAPTAGFASSRQARLFPTGRCKLITSPTEQLEVSVPESSSVWKVRVLDVVNVMISTDSFDVRARVPSPRLHLLASSSKGKTRLIESGEDHVDSAAPTPVRSRSEKENESLSPSMYEELLRIKTPPVLHDVELRSQHYSNSPQAKGTITIHGRITFGNFRNPDTHQAKQEVMIADAEEASRERRNQILNAQARSNEFNTSRQIERDATSRMQRLAANKRNARRSKAK